jgi:OmpA-like transmembrane domain
MKKIPVIVLVVLGLACAGVAAAAPKKQRKQNRVGPYAAVHVGMTEYTSDHGANEQAMFAILTLNDIPYQNAVTDTDESDFSYQLDFGFRFTRYFAAEFALTDYGSLVTTSQADLMFPNSGGFVPANNKLTFKLTGPLFSAIGILPINNNFELYGRLGFLFASTTREFTSTVEGNNAVSGSSHSDAQRPVIGLGVSMNFGQVYSVRAEFQRLTNVGESVRLPSEDIDVLHIGMVMRF